MRFLQPSVKRSYTEKMCSTKACEVGSLIRSCAKDTGLNMHPLFTKLQWIWRWRNVAQLDQCHFKLSSVSSRGPINISKLKNARCKHLKHQLKLGPETLRTQAKTISSFHNFSSW